MAKLNRTCIVCGRKYEYCSSCKDQAMLEPWHSIFHDNNCREIFNAVSMYGKDSNEDIKARLDKCDLSDKDNLHKNIVKVINELYSSKKNIEVVEEDLIVEAVKTVKEPIVAEVIETVIEEVVDKTIEDALEEQTKTEIKEVKPVYKNRKRK